MYFCTYPKFLTPLFCQLVKSRGQWQAILHCEMDLTERLLKVKTSWEAGTGTGASRVIALWVNHGSFSEHDLWFVLSSTHQIKTPITALLVHFAPSPIWQPVPSSHTMRQTKVRCQMLRVCFMHMHVVKYWGKGEISKDLSICDIERKWLPLAGKGLEIVPFHTPQARWWT